MILDCLLQVQSVLLVCSCVVCTRFSTEAIALFTPERLCSFVFALLPGPLFCIDRCMAHRCSLFTDLTARTSCMIDALGIVARACFRLSSDGRLTKRTALRF